MTACRRCFSKFRRGKNPPHFYKGISDGFERNTIEIFSVLQLAAQLGEDFPLPVVDGFLRHGDHGGQLPLAFSVVEQLVD